MQPLLRQALKIRISRGFTLIELMTAIAIIGILAAFSMPVYRGYVNEAKAASILVDLKSIGLAYHDAMLLDPKIDTNALDYDSPDFSRPPPALSALGPEYIGPDNIVYATYLVNHSGYFRFAHEGKFPIAFIKATNASERGVLHALNHVMEQQHAFVNEDLMVIALAEPMGRAGSYSSNQPPKTDVTGSETSSASNTDSTTGLTGTDSSTPDTPQAPDPASGDSSPPVSGTPPSATGAGSIGLNWPPGWVKHPEQHQGQNFHGHGHQ